MLRQRVRDQVERDREHRDRRSRRERGDRIEVDVAATLGDHHAPVCPRRLHAETEEVERRDEDHAVGDAQREVGGRRRHDVRKHLAEEDRPRSLATRLRGCDVLVRDHALRGAADESAHARQVDEHDREHEHDLGSTERRDRDQHDQKRRQRHQQVEAAGDQRVRRAAVVGAEHPERAADDPGQADGDEWDQDDRGPADEEPAERVAAELVRPEEMRRARAGRGTADADQVRRIRREEPPEDDHEQDDRA